MLVGICVLQIFFCLEVFVNFILSLLELDDKGVELEWDDFEVVLIFNDIFQDGKYCDIVVILILIVQFELFSCQQE